MNIKKIGVYGLGRFGQFWAELLAEDFQVIGYNRTSREFPGITLGSKEEVLSCDAVFFCVSISAFASVLEESAGFIGRDTVVFDTCSVKCEPARLMEQLLPAETQIVATHPMFGPDSARNGPQGLPFVFSPVRCSGETREYWKGYFDSIGLEVLEMSPEEHDREAAVTQGITHVIGRVLGDLQLQPSSIATMGYKKILEVVEQTCNDPYQLFLDLQHYNPYTHDMRLRLKESLDRVMHALEEADPET